MSDTIRTTDSSPTHCITIVHVGGRYRHSYLMDLRNQRRSDDAVNALRDGYDLDISLNHSELGPKV